jgi:hypothetical protein
VPFARHSHKHGETASIRGCLSISGSHTWRDFHFSAPERTTTNDKVLDSTNKTTQDAITIDDNPRQKNDDCRVRFQKGRTSVIWAHGTSRNNSRGCSNSSDCQSTSYATRTTTKGYGLHAFDCSSCLSIVSPPWPALRQPESPDRSSLLMIRRTHFQSDGVFLVCHYLHAEYPSEPP